MRTTILWVALCALTFSACDKKPAAQVGRSDSGSESRAGSMPTATNLPHPDEMTSPFAPQGVFFLLTRTSVETASGLFSYPAGTKVLKSGGKYVTFDGRQISLRADQVTNDLRIATRVAGNDPKVLAGIRASIQNSLATPNYMPPPTEAPQVFARPTVVRREDGLNPPKPALDGDERKADRSRKKTN